MFFLGVTRISRPVVGRVSNLRALLENLSPATRGHFTDLVEIFSGNSLKEFALEFFEEDEGEKRQIIEQMDVPLLRNILKAAAFVATKEMKLEDFDDQLRATVEVLARRFARVIEPSALWTKRQEELTDPDIIDALKFVTEDVRVRAEVRRTCTNRAQ